MYLCLTIFTFKSIVVLNLFALVFSCHIAHSHECIAYGHFMPSVRMLLYQAPAQMLFLSFKKLHLPTKVSMSTKLVLYFICQKSKVHSTLAMVTKAQFLTILYLLFVTLCSTRVRFKFIFTEVHLFSWVQNQVLEFLACNLRVLTQVKLTPHDTFPAENLELLPNWALLGLFQI